MAEHPNQPREYDAVKGGENISPINAAVLGGLAGIKKRLLSAVLEQRITALPDALNYGQAGLELVIQALNDSSEQVQRAAYLLLRRREETNVSEALRSFNHYCFFESLCILKGHSSAVKSIACSPDGQILASGGEDKTINLWNLQTRELIRTLEGHSKDVTSVAFSPDGQILASGSEDKTIKLWNWHTGELQKTLKGHLFGVLCVACSPDRQILASGSRDGTIKLWNLHTGKLQCSLEGHSYRINCVSFSPDGQILASGSGSNCSYDEDNIKLWDLQTGKLKRSLKGHDQSWGLDGVNCVTVSPDGQTLVSSSRESSIKLWNLHTGELQRTLQAQQYVDLVAFSPKGQILASCRSQNINLWNLNTGEIICTLETSSSSWITYFITSVTFSPDGESLASCSEDGTINIWGIP